ncbi:MAG: EAL domain-containing protein [Gammaproteobacteria bacterium]|nr:EAL domain-containing protein [Gammaproteobacteria bacterium]
MNIGQKNALFVATLVLMVLCGVTLSGYFLVRAHVYAEIDRDLARAQRVFVEAQRHAMENMVTTARGMSREPSLLAAALTSDTETVRGMLEDLYPRPGIDLVAVYLGTGSGQAIAEGSKPHFTSPQVLASEPLQQLLQQVSSGAPVAYGNALIFDTFLRLAAIPIQSPLGGAIGVLVTGQEINQASIDELKELVRAEVALFSGNVLLGSSLQNRVDLQQLNYAGNDRTPLRFMAGIENYIGHVYPVYGADTTTKVAHVLLAHSSDNYWAPYKRLGNSALIISAVILLIAMLVGITISRITLTRPIMALADATRHIASGDLTYQVRIRRRDELGQLADSFNSMLADLSASQVELERNRQRFHDFAESSSDWLWETDHHGRFVYVSSGVTDTLEMTADEFIGHTLAQIFPRDDLSDVMMRLQCSSSKCYPFKEVECVISLADGSRRHLRLNGMPIAGDAQVLGFRGTTRDVSKSVMDEERLVVLANQDQLTGLANRRRFLIDLAHEIRHAQSRNRGGVLMLIDLDHLKMVNDTAGHAVGDDLIVTISGLLKRMSRDEDLVARVSGDEFAIAFPDMDEQQAREKAAAVLEAVAECRPVHQGRTLNVSASLGMVMFPERGGDAVELLAKADTAMYSAKDAGRNRAKFYVEGDTSRERMGTQLAWKGRIVEALEDDLFELAFQPIASLIDGNVHHYECLVRMRDRDGGTLMPGNFIPTAEQFGLIGQVDRAILSKALRHLASLPADMANIGMSINLSGMSVGDDEVLALIESELKHTGVDPKRITFEVTETAACEQMVKASEFIARVRQFGCRISLDDFGVGFSSFSYLKNLRVDTLKIDGSFIRDIVRNREDQLFVKALVDVSRGMGIHTIAEFVENAATVEMLRRLGVDYVQGYYIGRPGKVMTKFTLGHTQASGGERAVAG